MKGHLGFRCRVCAVPGVVQNLRDSTVVVGGYSSSGYLTWDAPLDAGGGPIESYIVERFVAGSPGYWQIEADSLSTTLYVPICKTEPVYRVSARNRCGVGPATTFSSWTSPAMLPVILTGSGSWQPPCWAYSITAYCVGWGGQYSDGGAGGGLAWKTWTNYTTDDWPYASYVVTNAGGGEARSAFTMSGSTVTAYAGQGSDPGNVSGGDGGYAGQPGGTDNGSFSAAGISYSGTYYYGGGIGGCNPGGPGGTLICPSPVSPCKRRPANDRNNFMSAAANAGYRVTESCNTEAAIGSGGVRVPYSAYGSSNQYFAPGAGGGGFDSECPAGPGVIIVVVS